MRDISHTLMLNLRETKVYVNKKVFFPYIYSCSLKKRIEQISHLKTKNITTSNKTGVEKSKTVTGKWQI